jgi:hypothetical protein
MHMMCVDLFETYFEAVDVCSIRPLGNYKKNCIISEMGDIMEWNSRKLASLDASNL